MKNELVFLNLYKDYETIVRNHNLEPIDVENNSDEVTQGRLRLCRQFRNYLSHNNDVGFLEPTSKMIDFLDKQYQNYVLQDDIVKMHLKSANISICDSSDDCTVALEKMCRLKRNYLIIYYSDCFKYGIVSIYDVIVAVSKSKSSSLSHVKCMNKMALNIVTPTTLLSDIDTSILTICTSDGTAMGKCLGTLIL